MEKSQTLYKRILVKLSGEALMGNLEYGIEDNPIIIVYRIFVFFLGLCIEAIKKITPVRETASL